MAAKYRKIDPRIWTDESFELLNPIEKLVAIHLVTGQSNRIGLFKISIALGAEQCGIESDSYAKAILVVCDRLRWTFDDARRVIYIPTWFKYNTPENPKHLKGCLEDLHDVPQTHLISEFAKNVEHVPEHSKEAFSIAIGIAMPKGMPYQEQEQEQEQEQNNTPRPPAGENGSENGEHETPAPKNERARKSKTFVASVSESDLPASLRTAEFIAAVNRWIAFRADRKPKVSQLSLEEQIESLEKLGPARAVAAIKHSIANGWQGIFEAKTGGTHAKPENGSSITTTIIRGEV